MVQAPPSLYKQLLSKTMPLKRLLCGTALFTVPGITDRINTLEVAATEIKKKKKNKKGKKKKKKERRKKKKKACRK